MGGQSSACLIREWLRVMLMVYRLRKKRCSKSWDGDDPVAALICEENWMAMTCSSATKAIEKGIRVCDFSVCIGVGFHTAVTNIRLISIAFRICSYSVLYLYKRPRDTRVNIELQSHPVEASSHNTLEGSDEYHVFLK